MSDEDEIKDYAKHELHKNVTVAHLLHGGICGITECPNTKCATCMADYHYIATEEGQLFFVEILRDLQNKEKKEKESEIPF